VPKISVGGGGASFSACPFLLFPLLNIPIVGENKLCKDFQQKQGAFVFWVGGYGKTMIGGFLIFRFSFFALHFLLGCGACVRLAIQHDRTTVLYLVVLVPRYLVPNTRLSRHIFPGFPSFLWGRRSGYNGCRSSPLRTGTVLKLGQDSK
jgi:hypothetical protein